MSRLGEHEYSNRQHIKSEEADGQDHSPKKNLTTTSSSCFPIALKFIDVGYRVQVDSKSNRSSIRTMIWGELMDSPRERTILHGVSGMASPGEILAVLGPSGSGKSTLLNALAGRLHGHALTGSVLANGKKLTRSVLRRTGFVAQDDVLYPHLTVRETLVFCALLRLPNTVNRKDKVAAAEDVMSQLGLSMCENTIIGNAFIRGVSGGERKRVSIAHEMLVNPSLLILDEPTSGLDSTAAFRLTETLAELAKKGGKTVVASMHQPSSRVYQTFDWVLLLTEGTSLYFGKASEAMTYFNSLGFAPTFPMNPADFLLDLANDVFQLKSSTTEEEMEKASIRQSLISSYNHNLGPRVSALCSESTVSTTAPPLGVMVVGKRRRNGPAATLDYNNMGSAISTWLSHFSILFHRSLKERRHESFNSLRVLQVLSASLLSGTMWWHSDPLDVQDRLGLLFFISIFWGVFPSFNSVFAFPQDRAILLKERASGVYTLSPYFMARVVGDLPMDLILPTLFLSLTYWMSGLRPELGAFILTLLVLLGYVLVAGGLGLALGALIMDAKRASTIVTITMLAFVLTGGYYVHKLPACFSWIKYASVTFYCYRLLIQVQYGQGDTIWTQLHCSHAPHENNVAAGSCKFIQEDILEQINPISCVAILGMMFVGFRLIAYLALRRLRY